MLKEFHQFSLDPIYNNIKSENVDWDVINQDIVDIFDKL